VIEVLLDTSICVELIRRRLPAIQRRLRGYEIGSVGISSITLAELQYGASRSSDPDRNAIALAHFCAPLSIASFDDSAAVIYGNVRAALERNGTPIGPLDTLIAAHALALSATLITNNEREFKRVPELTVENWARD
jgi:tRNA(fMet)-specific endonuclease VapC